ncbi:MAG: hypothetical protein ISR65_12745 [Bacteriovoracaceae bacterium]|nr:hypothetical protein [Bacteriovoracaceae bacterium]
MFKGCDMTIASKGISYKILLYVVLCSSVFTLLATAFQLYLEFAEESGGIDDNIQHIEQSYLKIIGVDVYKLDNEHLELIMDHIVSEKHIVYVEIKESIKGREYITSKGSTTFSKDVLKTYPITFKYGKKVINLGEMTIVASYDGIYKQLFKRILRILIINGVKTFITSFFIFLIIQYALTRHLTRIVSSIKTTDPKNFQPIVLDRKTKNPDELDHVVSSLNELSNNVMSYLKQHEIIEDNFKKAYVAKTQFLGHVSHEFKTPINAILGFSDLLKTDYSIEYVEKIQHSGHELLEHIDCIITLSQLDDNSMSFDEEVFSLNELVDKVVGGVNFLDNRFKLFLDKTLEELYLGNRGHIEQILNALLYNAIKFTDNGQINLMISKITAKDELTKIQFCLEDTGIGISREFMSEAYLPFSQEDDSLQKQFKGVGLGLTLVKKLVDALNGHVEILSVKGKGTTVTVILYLEGANNGLILEKVKSQRKREKLHLASQT